MVGADRPVDADILPSLKQLGDMSTLDNSGNVYDADTLKIVQEIDRYLEGLSSDNTKIPEKSDEIKNDLLNNHDTVAFDDIIPNESVNKQFTKRNSTAMDKKNSNNPIDNFSFVAVKINNVQDDITPNESVNKQFTNNSTPMNKKNSNNPIDSFSFASDKVGNIQGYITPNDCVHKQLKKNSTTMNKKNSINPIDNFSFASEKVGNIQENIIQKANVQTCLQKQLTKTMDAINMNNPMNDFSFAFNKIGNIQDHSLKIQNIMSKPYEKFDYSVPVNKELNTQNYEQIVSQRDLDISSNTNHSGFQKGFPGLYEQNPQKNCPSSLLLKNNDYSLTSSLTQPDSSKFQFKKPFFEGFKLQPKESQGKYQLGHNIPFGWNNNELKNSSIGNHKPVFNNFQVPCPLSPNQSPKDVNVPCLLNINDLNRQVQNKQQFNLPDHKFKQCINMSPYENKQFNLFHHEKKQHFHSPHHENKPNLNLPSHENKQNFNLPHHEIKQNSNLLCHENKQNFNLPHYENKPNPISPCYENKQNFNLSHHENKLNFNSPRYENKQNLNLPHHENKPNLNSPLYENKQNLDWKRSDSSSMPIHKDNLHVSSQQISETSHTQTNNNVLRVIKDNLCPESLNGSTIQFSSRKLINSNSRDELVIALNKYGTLEFSWWTPDDLFFARYISSYDAQYVYQLYTK